LVRLLGGPRAAWVARATRPGTPQAAAMGTPKPQAYVRPPVARALPDRWLMRAYTGTAVIGEAWTAPVAPDPHLAPDPQSVPGSGGDGSTGRSDGLAVDPELQWLIDYATAVAAGMAVDVPLPPGTTRVDRVVAVGVRASTAPADGAGELGALLTAHRYTDGLGFLPVGSATSNTPGQRSAGDRHSDPITLWECEFGAPAGAEADAARLALALGVRPGVVDGVENATDSQDAPARAMQTATWAATWGYYLRELIEASTLGGATIEAVRAHYLAYVRGRGTQPTLRVGRQPYGVLPLLPLARWATDGAAPVVDRTARLLQNVRPLWQHGIGAPVTAAEGTDFDTAFTRVMSTGATGRSYSIRSAVADRSVNPLIFTGIDPAPGVGVIDAMIGSLLGLGSNPLILDVFSPTAQPVRAPLVVDPTDPTPDATVQAAIRGLKDANPMLVLAKTLWFTPRPSGPATLLHTLLRRSVLLEYAAAGVSLRTLVPLVPAAPGVRTAAGGEQIGQGDLAVAEAGEPLVAQRAAPTATTGSLLVGLSPDPSGGFTPVATTPGLLSAPLASVTGSLATGEWLWRNPTLQSQSRQSLDETLTALDQLAGLTAADLEILLPETLDLATHRWTAWAESIAAEKLDRLRAATPAGITLGGWGVVEGVARAARTAVDPAISADMSTGPLWENARAGGFVHAPSTAQAATAAVLRSGHLAHGGDIDTTFAVDLSSGQARIATTLAEGIRNGQELGALLGYEIERYLHEHSADALIAPLRAYAPRWKASGTFVEGEPEEIVSPSAVVDGLALATADVSAVVAAVIPGSAAGNPALAATLTTALQWLQSHQDALADLLTAEAVHQVLLGNAARASAALDAAARGGLPPAEFDVLRTPRRGAALTCRVGVLLPEPGGAPRGGWPQSPRGAADPAVTAWLAAMLPPLSAVRLRVADPQGAEREVAIPAGTALGPLDLVLDTAEVVRTRVQLGLPPGSTLIAGRAPGWSALTVGLDELLTLAARLRDVVSARPLRAADLVPAQSPPEQAEERDAVDLLARCTAARKALQAAQSAVSSAAGALAVTAEAATLTAARSALITAISCGVVIQLPVEATSLGQVADLAAALVSADAELARRLSAPAPDRSTDVDGLTAALRGLLGSGQPAVPVLTVTAAVAAAAGLAVTAGAAFLASDPELAADWVADLGAVRAATRRLAVALQDSAALSGPAGADPGWIVLDPLRGSAWVATLGAAALDAGATATTVLAQAPGAAATASRFAPGSRLSGLVVDDWTEVVPEAQAATSLTYQADAPPARAPQAVLLGVVPDTAHGWDVDTVADLVLEAMDLTRLRTVDAETGAWAGRMLPAVLLPDGDAADVVETPPRSLLVMDATILEAARAATKELG
jgi:hypothetical protein